MQYHVVLGVDEDGAWFADVPALPGCVSGASTREECLANIKEAIEGWLLAQMDKDEEIPEDENLVEVTAVEVDVDALRAEWHAEPSAQQPAVTT
jgi:predicted RNase H-like HicB family nuclease